MIARPPYKLLGEPPLTDLDFRGETVPSDLTFSRGSSAYPITSDVAGFGVRVTEYASGTMAFGYNAGFSHPSKMGAVSEFSSTNLCLQSEDLLTTWTLGGSMARAANQGEAPDGANTADTITAGANNDYLESGAMAVSASGNYTASLFIRRNGGSDVSGRLIHYDATGAAEETAAAFTAGADWTRISVYDASAASTSRTLRIEIDTSGESIYAWGAQLEADDLTSYMPTTTVPALRLITNMHVVSTGTFHHGEAGEVESVTAGMPADTLATPHVFEVQPTSGDIGRMYFRILSIERASFDIFDSSGSVAQNIDETSGVDWSVEQRTRCRWDASTDIPGHGAKADLDTQPADEHQDGTSTGWTSADGGDIYIGSRESLGGHIQGLISRVRIWSAPRAD